MVDPILCKQVCTVFAYLYLSIAFKSATTSKRFLLLSAYQC